MVDYAHSELVAYAGMILILSAFVLETRGALHSKEFPYLALMALGSGPVSYTHLTLPTILLV